MVARLVSALVCEPFPEASLDKLSHIPDRGFLQSMRCVALPDIHQYNRPLQGLAYMFRQSTGLLLNTLSFDEQTGRYIYLLASRLTLLLSVVDA